MARNRMQAEAPGEEAEVAEEGGQLLPMTRVQVVPRQRPSQVGGQTLPHPNIAGVSHATQRKGGGRVRRFDFVARCP